MKGSVVVAGMAQWRSYQHLIGTEEDDHWNTSASFNVTIGQPIIVDVYSQAKPGPGWSGHGAGGEGSGTISFAIPSEPIPDPATIALLGLGGIIISRRRCR